MLGSIFGSPYFGKLPYIYIYMRIGKESSLARISCKSYIGAVLRQSFLGHSPKGLWWNP